MVNKLFVKKKKKERKMINYNCGHSSKNKY